MYLPEWRGPPENVPVRGYVRANANPHGGSPRNDMPLCHLVRGRACPHNGVGAVREPPWNLRIAAFYAKTSNQTANKTISPPNRMTVGVAARSGLPE